LHCFIGEEAEPGFHAANAFYLSVSIAQKTTANKPISPFLIADTVSNAQSGSNLSLASATTNEADSVNSGGAGSQR